MNGNRYPCANIQTAGFPKASDPVWDKAPAAFLADVVTGAEPFLSTECRLFRDDAAQMLYLRFLGQDDGVLSNFRLHDEPLYRQDVFELFVVDGDNPLRYREIEVSPYDVHFDGDIIYHARKKLTLDLDWDMKGFKTETRYDAEKSRISSVWAMPYGVFARAPKAGESWRFNMFRIDHSARGEALSAWQKTGEANFHVPEAFGYLDFA